DPGMRVPRLAGVGLAVALAMASVCAVAQELTAEQRETARFFMQEARTFREKGNLRGALDKFKAADALVHAPTNGLAVPRTYASLGMLVEARDAALHVIRIPERQDEPSVYKTARLAAAKLSEDLQSSIPTLTIGAKDGGKPVVPILTRVDEAEVTT